MAVETDDGAAPALPELPVVRAAELDADTSTPLWLVQNIWLHLAVGWCAGLPKKVNNCKIANMHMIDENTQLEKTVGLARLPVRGTQTGAERAGRRVLKGTVVKSAMKDTATVSVRHFVKHKKYGKYIKREKKFLVHDVENTARVGDTVLIQETRPISKRKNFILKETVVTAHLEK